MSKCELFQKILKGISYYFPQILGVIGTLSGTILGWLLKYLQDNLGKTEIIVEDLMHYRNENNQYAYNTKIFICNHSLKPKYINDFKIVFQKKNKKISEKIPSINNAIDSFLDFSEKESIEIVNIKHNEPQYIIFCGLIEKDEFIKLKDADRIILTYKNNRGRIKKKTINKNFSLDCVPKYKKSKWF